MIIIDMKRLLYNKRSKHSFGNWKYGLEGGSGRKFYLASESNEESGLLGHYGRACMSTNVLTWGLG